MREEATSAVGQSSLGGTDPTTADQHGAFGPEFTCVWSNRPLERNLELQGR
jgi:hypothetical protein